MKQISTSGQEKITLTGYTFCFKQQTATQQQQLAVTFKRMLDVKQGKPMILERGEVNKDVGGRGGARGSQPETGHEGESMWSLAVSLQ